VRTVQSIDELADLVAEHRLGEDLYVRWSQGPREDQETQSSRDGLTGVTLPGLSANPLRVEPWWGERSVRLWVARRLYDYRHLRELHGPDVRPWVLRGEQRGRGPDNEPLVVCHEPIAWVSERALRQCEEAMHRHGSDEWGPLDRTSEISAPVRRAHDRMLPRDSGGPAPRLAARRNPCPPCGSAATSPPRSPRPRPHRRSERAVHLTCSSGRSVPRGMSRHEPCHLP